MSKSPYSHLSAEDYMALRLSAEHNGETIFEGEEVNPVFNDNRHALLNTQYLEVSPDQLIDVAKSIDSKEMKHQEVIKKAYALICEAHLVSKNIRHWNESVSRNHQSKLIFDLVKNSLKNDKGQPLRKELLVDFFKALQSPKHEKDASKEFNKWFSSKVRLDDYMAFIPWNPSVKNHDPAQYKKLIELGWITWHGNNLVIPEAVQPKRMKKVKLKQNQHVTEPYWTTKDVWWSEAKKESIEELKNKYLSPRRDVFLNDDVAAQALDKFHQWYKVDQSIRRSSSKKSPNTIHRGKDGKIVSKKDKGSSRGEDGKYQ